MQGGSQLHVALLEIDKCHVHQSFLLKGVVPGNTIRYVMATDPSQCTMYAHNNNNIYVHVLIRVHAL